MADGKKNKRVIVVCLIVAVLCVVISIFIIKSVINKKSIEEDFVSFVEDYAGKGEIEVTSQEEPSTEEESVETETVIIEREDRYAEEITDSKGSEFVDEYWSMVEQGVDPFIAKITVMEPEEVKDVSRGKEINLSTSQAEYELTFVEDMESVDTELLPEDLALFKLSNPENGDDICRLVMHICDIRGWDIMNTIEYYNHAISINVEDGYGTGVFVNEDNVIVAASVNDTDNKVIAIVLPLESIE